MSLINRESAVKIAERYSISKGTTIGKHSGTAEIIADEIKSLPSVDAVPLDKLCEWLSERNISIPCIYCTNYENEHYCTAIWDKSRHCPKTADDWRKAIMEWMEEQNA